MEALLVVVAVGVQEIGAIARRLIEHRLRNRRDIGRLRGLRADVLFDLLGGCAADGRKRECKRACNGLCKCRHGVPPGASDFSISVAKGAPRSRGVSRRYPGPVPRAVAYAMRC